MYERMRKEKLTRLKILFFGPIIVIYGLHIWDFPRKFLYWEKFYFLRGVFIGLLLYYIGSSVAILKWHMSIVLFPLKGIKWLKPLFKLTEEDLRELRLWGFKVDKNEKVKMGFEEVLVIVSLFMIVYGQLLVWIRALLYHLFGWKIPLIILDIPELTPWK